MLHLYGATVVNGGGATCFVLREKLAMTVTSPPSRKEMQCSTDVLIDGMELDCTMIKVIWTGRVHERLKGVDASYERKKTRQVVASLSCKMFHGEHRMNY